MALRELRKSKENKNGMVKTRNTVGREDEQGRRGLAPLADLEPVKVQSWGWLTAEVKVEREKGVDADLQLPHHRT